MSMTNCVNCGAAKEETDVKCPFCGTLYFDMTAIDFDSMKPVACAFILPGSKQKMTMLAIPQLDAIEAEAVPFFSDNRLAGDSFVDRYELRVSLRFNAVEHPDGSIFKVYQGGGA